MSKARHWRRFAENKNSDCFELVSSVNPLNNGVASQSTSNVFPEAKIEERSLRGRRDGRGEQSDEGAEERRIWGRLAENRRSRHCILPLKFNSAQRYTLLLTGNPANVVRKCASRCELSPLTVKYLTNAPTTPLWCNSKALTSSPSEPSNTPVKRRRPGKDVLQVIWRNSEETYY